MYGRLDDVGDERPVRKGHCLSAMTSVATSKVVVSSDLGLSSCSARETQQCQFGIPLPRIEFSLNKIRDGGVAGVDPQRKTVLELGEA
jgi:hypothetical protein